MDGDKDGVWACGIVEWFLIVALPVLCSFFPSLNSSVVVVSPRVVEFGRFCSYLFSFFPSPMYPLIFVYPICFLFFSWNACLKK